MEILDLSKFLDLLMSKKLFMSRSDKFEEYEGTLVNLLLKK
jgi:hypothetical protein